MKYLVRSQKIIKAYKGPPLPKGKGPNKPENIFLKRRV